MDTTLCNIKKSKQRSTFITHDKTLVKWPLGNNFEYNSKRNGINNKQSCSKSN